MRLFDLHCDTITECYAGSYGLRQNPLQVSLEKGGVFSTWCQTYAVFIQDTLRGRAAVKYFNAVYEYFLHQLAQNPCLAFVTARETLDAAMPALLSVEGGAVLAGELGRVEQIFRQGVRMMTLTWNGANELGDGAMVPTGYGLTPFGKEAVREMNRLGMVVDVSHLSDAGFWDVCRLGDSTFVATHSNARAVCAHPRNLTDEQIREIIKRRGLIGLNLYTEFLGEDAEERGCEAAFRHVEHILGLGGEQVLCMGCDFDGAHTPKELANVGDLPRFYRYLNKKGLPEPLIDRIFYKNAHDYFRSVLQSEKTVL